MNNEFDEEKAKEALEAGMAEAESTIKDEKKTKKLFENIEKKLKNSKLNGVLKEIPILVSILKSYCKGEYKEIPIGSIIAIVSALIYWVSPIDIIPDFIPGFGHVDDAAVLLVCLTFVKADLDAYKEWLEEKDSNQN